MTHPERVRERLQIPDDVARQPSRKWAHFGEKAACDGCGDVIDTGDLQHDIAFADGTLVELHVECADAWERLRGDRRAA